MDKLEAAADDFFSNFDTEKWSDALGFVQDFMDHLDYLDRNYPGAMDVFKKSLREGEQHILAFSGIPGGVYEEKDNEFRLASSGEQDKIGIIAFPKGRRARMDIRYGPEGKKYKLKGVKLGILEEFGDDPVYIKLPSWVEFTFSDDNSTRIVWHLDLEPVDINRDNTLCPDDDALKSSIDIRLEDYLLSIAQCDLYHDGRHVVGGALKRGSKMLLSFTSKVNITIKTEVHLSLFIVESVQIMGDVEPVAYKKYKKECDNNSANLNALRQSLVHLNNSITLGLYYDGSEKRQARLAYDIFRDGDGLQTWHLSPVFSFNDGSSRAWDELSEDSNFRSITDIISKWIDKINDSLSGE